MEMVIITAQDICIMQYFFLKLQKLNLFLAPNAVLATMNS